MEKLVLKSEKRESSECVKTLRNSKKVPAVVYGHKQENISIKVDNSDMLRTYRVAGENHIIELNIDNKKIDVLVHDVQFHPVTGYFLHVDFYAITKGEKVHTHIPLTFIGASRAKTEEGAVIEELVKQVEVKCLPQDLVDSFEVDLSKLEKTGDNIKVGDLNIPSKFEIINTLDEVLVIAAKSKVEKEETIATTQEVPTEEQK